MNWITNFVRPKIRALVSPKETPENLWIKCPNCEEMLFHKELEENTNVCYKCGHHMRIGMEDRLALLYGDEPYTFLELPKAAIDPLKFRDLKSYKDRLRDAHNKTGKQGALAAVEGTIKDNPVVTAAFDFSFMGGSMGVAVGEAIVTAAEKAVETRSALLVIPASGGARMQEGILSLMQMPRTTIAVQMVKDAGLPYIVLLTDPTTGGVSASFAMLGDIQIAEPGTYIGFAGKRVIAETIREDLPAGFQTAEYLLDHGMIDMVVKRHALRDTLGQILTLLMQPVLPEITPATTPAPEPAPDDEAA